MWIMLSEHGEPNILVCFWVRWLTDLIVSSHDTDEPLHILYGSTHKCLPDPKSLFEMASFCVKHDWQAIIFLKAAFHFFFAVLENLSFFISVRCLPKTKFHQTASFTKLRLSHVCEIGTLTVKVDHKVTAIAEGTEGTLCTHTFLILIATHLFIGCDCLKEWWACFARLLVLIPQES